MDTHSDATQAVCVFNKPQVLTDKYVYELLTTIVTDAGLPVSLITATAGRIANGNVYLYRNRDDAQCLHDGYEWQTLPCSKLKQLVNISCYKLVTGAGMRYVYKLHDSDEYTLVHYLGEFALRERSDEQSMKVVAKKTVVAKEETVVAKDNPGITKAAGSVSSPIGDGNENRGDKSSATNNSVDGVVRLPDKGDGEDGSDSQYKVIQVIVEEQQPGSSTSGYPALRAEPSSMPQSATQDAAVCLRVLHHHLQRRFVTAMLDNVCDAQVSNVPARLPTGGQMFIYPVAMKDTALKDGYRWTMHYKSLVPKDTPQYMKVKYICKDTPAPYSYQRCVYADDSYMLVHYVGHAPDMENIEVEDTEDVDTAVTNTQHEVQVQEEENAMIDKLYSTQQDQSGADPVCLFEQDEQLSLHVAHRLLSHPKKTHFSTHPPKLPAVGQVYLYHNPNDKDVQYYLDDQHRWRFEGSYYLPPTRPVINRFSYIDSCDAVCYNTKRYVYKLLGNTRYILVHYAKGNPALCGTMTTEQVTPSNKASPTKPQQQPKGDNAPTTSGSSSSGTLEEVDLSFLLHLCKDEDGPQSEAVKPLDSVCLMKCTHRLSTVYAYSILAWPNKHRITRSRVYRPTAGQVYLYNDWKVNKEALYDGYVWRETRQENVTQQSSSLVHTREFICKDSSIQIVRYVYTLHNDTTCILVQYVSSGADTDTADTDTADAASIQEPATKKQRLAPAATTTTPLQVQLQQQQVTVIHKSPVVLMPADQACFDDQYIERLVNRAQRSKTVTTDGQPVLMRVEAKLSLKVALSILRWTNKQRVSTTTVCEPQGGDVVLYRLHAAPGDVTSELGHRDADTLWQVDGHEWYNRGICQFKHATRIDYFVAGDRYDGKYGKFDTKFNRSVFMDKEPSMKGQYALVHYLGDANLSAHHKGPKLYYATPPSAVREHQTSQVAGDGYYEIHYDDALNQVTNITLRQSLSSANNSSTETVAAFTKQDLMNSIESQPDTDKFIQRLVTYPNFVCVAARSEVLDILNTFFTQCGDVPIIFSYQTTHQVDNYHVTVVTVSHPLCTENTIVPVAIVVHDQPINKIFDEVLNMFTAKVNNLRNSHFVFVIDRDDSMQDKLSAICPLVHAAHCWDQMKQDFAASEGAALSDDRIAGHQLELHSLLQCSDTVQFQELYTQLSHRWSVRRIDYFEKCLKPYIIRYSARWMLQQHGAYSEPDGIVVRGCHTWVSAAQDVANHPRLLPTDYLKAFNKVQVEILDIAT